MWSIVFIVKVLSWHPTLGEDPNWYLTPCFLIILNNLLQIKLLNTLDPMSVIVTPLHLLVSKRSPLLDTGTTWPSCHSSKSTFSSQNLVMKLKWWRRFSSDMDLKALEGHCWDRVICRWSVPVWHECTLSTRGGRQVIPWPTVSLSHLSLLCMSFYDCWVLYWSDLQIR